MHYSAAFLFYADSCILDVNVIFIAIQTVGAWKLENQACDEFSPRDQQDLICLGQMKRFLWKVCWNVLFLK